MELSFKSRNQQSLTKSIFGTLFTLAIMPIGCQPGGVNKRLASDKNVAQKATADLAAAPLASDGCSKTGEIQLCPLRSGSNVYENGGNVLTQVVLTNNTSDAYVISRIDVTRVASQTDWQEVGVFKCRISDGFGCSLSPPGQINHGVGEVHYLNSQPRSQQFVPEARFDGFTSMLIIEPGYYVLLNSSGVAGGKFTVDARLRKNAAVFTSESWRLPRRDVNFGGGSLNYCSGGVDNLLDWGVGKNNPDGVNHYWTNDTGKELHISSVTAAITSGSNGSLFKLSHKACLSMYSPAGSLVAESCVVNSDGLYWFDWTFPPGYKVALQGHNQCAAGNVWNMVAFLHVYDAASSVPIPQQTPIASVPATQSTQTASVPMSQNPAASVPQRASLPAASHCKDSLHPNETLEVNQQLCSSNGVYVLTMQGDGNLVIAEKATGHVLWHTNQRGDSPRSVFQGDGNFVVYRTSGDSQVAVWQTMTNGTSAQLLILQNDGNLAIYSTSGQILWHRMQ